MCPRRKRPPTETMSDAVDALERGELPAGRLSKLECEEYSDRVAELMGRDRAAAIRLSRRYRYLLQLADEVAPIWRAHAIGLWLEGRWLSAAEAFQTAGRTASSRIERCTYRIGAIDAYARAGRIEQAEHLGRRLIGRLRALGDPESGLKAALNLANAFEQADRFREAKRLYGTALALPGLREQSQARLGISTCELFIGSPTAAVSFAREAAAGFRSLDLPTFANLCDVNVALASHQMGRSEETIRALANLRAGSDRLGLIEETLGDAYAHLNLMRQAEACYREALSLPISAASRANCHLGLARILKGGEALKSARRAKAAFKRIDDRVGELMCAPVIAGLGGAHRLLPQNAQELARLGWRRAAAEALLTYAEASPTEESITEAGRAVRRAGIISENWRLLYLRARRAKGAARLRLVRALLRAVVEDRMRLDSSVARMAMLSDKRAAIDLYLETLLERPKPARLREVVEGIGALRSAALLDELLGGVGLSGDAAERFAALRRELQTAEAFAGRSDDLRRVRRFVPSQRTLRLWSESAVMVRAGLAEIEKRPSDCLVLAQTPGTVIAISPRAKSVKSISSVAFESARKRLAFEILDAAFDPNANPTTALRELERAKVVFRELSPNAPDLVCPDDGMWNFPLHLMGSNRRETLIALSPWADAEAHEASISKDASVLLLHGDCSGLPQADREIDLVQSLFPAMRLARTAEEARNNLNEGHWSLVIAVGHARHEVDNPMFSSLMFSNGPLFAFEIARCRANVGVAVLSACETGKLTSAFGEPDGLVRAFLARSAKAVIGGAWWLHDQASFRLSQVLYPALRSGEGVGAALSKSRSELRMAMPHPFHWGAPVLFAGHEHLARSASGSEKEAFHAQVSQAPMEPMPCHHHGGGLRRRQSPHHL